MGGVVLKDRRLWIRSGVSCAAAVGMSWMPSSAWAGIAESDAAAGIREALSRAADAAIATLGRQDGFLADPKVRIPLPAALQAAGRLMAATGQRAKVDELVVGMNRAAEQAVPQARALLSQAIRDMSVEDAVGIVRGPDDAVTRYFADKTRRPLAARFEPIVARVVAGLPLVDRYNAVVLRASALGVGRDVPTVQQHVTSSAIDGLFVRMADEERRLRSDPAAAGSALLRRVFGG